MRTRLLSIEVAYHNPLRDTIANLCLVCKIKIMGKVKTDSTSFWSRLGGVKKLDFKARVLQQHKLRKEAQRSIENSLIDEKRAPKMMLYPTGYMKIDDSTTESLYRHVQLTGSVAISSCMEDKTINEVNQTVERHMGNHRQQEPVLTFAGRLFAGFDAFYTKTDDALCHFVSAADDPVIRHILFRASQFMLNAENRAVRVFVDGINGEKSLERYASFETSFTPSQDVGTDLAAFAKLINWTTHASNSDQKSVLAERVRWSCERRKVVKSVHDIEGISKILMEKRKKCQTPIPGLSFVDTTCPSLLYHGLDNDCEEKVVFELIVKLPAVSAEKKMELKETLDKSPRINAVVQYLPN